jgi:S1-C subfamily serine protease
VSDRVGGRARRRYGALWFGVGAVLIATVVLIVAVLVGHGSDSPAAGPPCPRADGRTRELRRCLAESVAYVETPNGSGSGLLVSDGYVVTNAHVVDPFGRVDVVFDGGERHGDVPVVGVDAAADVAVVGPIDTDRPALALGPLEDLDEREDSDVFRLPGRHRGPRSSPHPLRRDPLADAR